MVPVLQDWPFSAGHVSEQSLGIFSGQMWPLADSSLVWEFTAHHPVFPSTANCISSHTNKCFLEDKLICACIIVQLVPQHAKHCTLHIANCKLQTANCILNCTLQTTGCKLYVFNCFKLKTANYKNEQKQTAHCFLHSANFTIQTSHCKLHTENSTLHDDKSYDYIALNFSSLRHLKTAFQF